MDFYTGAAGPPGRFHEGFSLRRAHSGRNMTNGRAAVCCSIAGPGASLSGPTGSCTGRTGSRASPSISASKPPRPRSFLTSIIAAPAACRPPSTAATPPDPAPSAWVRPAWRPSPDRRVVRAPVGSADHHRRRGKVRLARPGPVDWAVVRHRSEGSDGSLLQGGVSHAPSDQGATQMTARCPIPRGRTRRPTVTSGLQNRPTKPL